MGELKYLILEPKNWKVDTQENIIRIIINNSVFYLSKKTFNNSDDFYKLNNVPLVYVISKCFDKGVNWIHWLSDGNNIILEPNYISCDKEKKDSNAWIRYEPVIYEKRKEKKKTKKTTVWLKRLMYFAFFSSIFMYSYVIALVAILFWGGISFLIFIGENSSVRIFDSNSDFNILQQWMLRASPDFSIFSLLESKESNNINTSWLVSESKESHLIDGVVQSLQPIWVHESSGLSHVRYMVFDFVCDDTPCSFHCWMDCSVYIDLPTAWVSLPPFIFEGDDVVLCYSDDFNSQMRANNKAFGINDEKTYPLYIFNKSTGEFFGRVKRICDKSDLKESYVSCYSNVKEIL